ncbi:MAG: hypothetical protein QXS85_01795 [Acidilobaceae archaeon]
MEEPREPPREDCRVRVVGGGAVIDMLLDGLRRAIYEYNSRIKHTGYYLKPLHKVYKTTEKGSRRVYEYYGVYWWRLVKTEKGVRYLYVGKETPPELPEPPILPIPHGLSLIREGRDVVLDCRVYDRFRELFRGLHVSREES